LPDRRLRTGRTGPPLRKRALNVALGIFSTIIGLAGGEALCRAVANDRPPLRFEAFADRMEDGSVMQAVVTSAVVRDPDLFWRLAPDTTLSTNPWMPGLVANRQGLRESADIPIPKPSGEVRILFLGDSCTFGWGLEEADGLVARVEATLRSRFPRRPIQCINAGVPAYTAFQGWRYLIGEGLAYQPDLVVVTFGNNESISWDGRSDFEHHAAWQASLPPAGLRWSALARLAWQAAASPLPAAEARRPRLTPEEFRLALERIAKASAAAGADLLYISWPVRENLEPHRSASDRHPLQRVIAEIGAHPPTPRLEILDLVPVAQGLATHQALSVLYLDQIHATAFANRAYGRAVADQLAGWIRDHPSPTGEPAADDSPE